MNTNTDDPDMPWWVWPLVVILLALLCGCGNSRALPCISGKSHEWSKWEDRTQASDLGYVLQDRHCTNCNLIDREWHK